MSPDSRHFLDVIDATWPAARRIEAGPFTLRDGRGGGKRVSAATATGPATADAVSDAEAAMRDLGQRPLFMIRDSDAALDALLADRGYRVVDPVAIHAAPIGLLTAEAPPPATIWTIWEPLAIMRDIWADGGIGPERCDVMRRATCPRTGLLARRDQNVAAAGFVGLHQQTAMMHALEVRPEQRRHGMARHMMRAAAIWAAAQGAERISAVCTRANAGACALYASLGMQVVGQYHYRQHPDGDRT